MAAHIDILEQRESLRSPLVGSLVFHVFVFASMALYGSIGTGGRISWGDPNSLGGGSVGITPVQRLPVPARAGRVNPLANDTESRVPRAPKPAPRRAAPAEEKAIDIKGRQSASTPTRSSSRRPTTAGTSEGSQNQLYSSAGQAAVSPMFGGQTGAGGVGVGTGSAFGNRFGYYVEILRRRVAEKWQTGDVDPRLQTAPPVIVTFEIRQDGSVRNVKLMQRSGTSALDYSAQRAVYDASPFPPLPAGYERNEATIEFWFELKR